MRLLLFTCISLMASAGDWTTFGHDPARSGWAPDEKTLSPGNVSNMKLLWSAKLDNKSYSLSALTAPVVLTGLAVGQTTRGVVYLAGISGTIFALDAQSGEPLWQRSLKTMALPRKGGLQGTFLCPNGITATPVIDSKNKILYVIAPDGSLYGLDAATGKIRFGPAPFVAPFSKNWSLNLVDSVVYTTVSLGCGNGMSGIYAADVTDAVRPQVRITMLSRTYTAGIWGQGGPVIGGGKIYGGTADGDSNPAGGDYSSTVVAADINTMRVEDYFRPTNWAELKKMDLDVGSASPAWFEWNHRHLLAHGFKEGVVYLLDADHIGDSDHSTPLYTSPRLGNDKQACCEGLGIWGGLSSSRDETGRTWIYVPMAGPPSVQAPVFPVMNGDPSHGSIMAFLVVNSAGSLDPVLEPRWVSGGFNIPSPVVIANGLVFGISTGENPDQRGDESRRFLNTRPATLKVLDAQTGRELYTSGDVFKTWVHFTGLAIAGGRIYAVDHDSNVYCFGLASADLTTSNNVPRVRMAAFKTPNDENGTAWISRADHQDEILANWALRASVVLLLGALACLVGIRAAKL